MSAAFDSLQQAFREDPQGFELFVAGVLAAGQRTAPLNALPPPTTNLGQIFDLYGRISCVAARTTKNNMHALAKIISCVLGESDPSKVALGAVDKTLIFRYQELAASAYTAKAADELGKREALSRALRSTKSAIAQARCVFVGRGIDLLARYESEGLHIPPCVRDFVTCKTRGEKRKKNYVSATHEFFQGLFEAIEVKRAFDERVYLAFWIIMAFALRQGELRNARWEHLVEKDGKLFYWGGVGKNGETIRVQAQERAATVLRDLRKECGTIVDYEAGKRLNWFLRARGLKTQKAAHELRAWIGSLIFEKDPRAAKEHLRHSSLKITEDSYCRYVRPAQTPNVI